MTAAFSGSACHEVAPGWRRPRRDQCRALWTATGKAGPWRPGSGSCRMGPRSWPLFPPNGRGPVLMTSPLSCAVLWRQSAVARIV